MFSYSNFSLCHRTVLYVLILPSLDCVCRLALSGYELLLHVHCSCFKTMFLHRNHLNYPHIISHCILNFFFACVYCHPHTHWPTRNPLLKMPDWENCIQMPVLPVLKIQPGVEGLKNYMPNVTRFVVWRGVVSWQLSSKLLQSRLTGFFS
jgi:hypothetical protein